MRILNVSALRAADIWLRRPARARAILAAQPTLDVPSLSLLAWLTLTVEQDEKHAESLARTALGHVGDSRFATAALTEVLLRRGEYDEAIEVIGAARHRFPAIRWYELTLADTLVEAGRITAAEDVLEEAAADPVLRRHALKRLSKLALDRGDHERARYFLEPLVALAPDYLVYASDYIVLGHLYIEAGEPDKARDTWHKGAEVYVRNSELRALLMRHFGEQGPSIAPRIARVDERRLGAKRIPVRTPMISFRTGITEVVDTATAMIRRPGDVIAFSESAAAAGQGRMLPLELVDPSLMAAVLCRFVGKIGPLSSPAGMQGAIMEVGRAKVALGAVAGAVGRLLGRRGWFYRVTGPATAMIDDVAACMPPHDHHLIFGPSEADALSEQLAAALRCGVAVVDANHRSGATIIGASREVDRNWLVTALADNPAGNEDEQTPVVIIRPLEKVTSQRA
ncbi:tetratricopeptide repeat protein [Rhizohabitans arisaemae]|uniref:tetratricopeptide repeat protein n=1 Tax=Rhizohabitans arisaemae TaxID=2720610 RepID=UPI0024B074FF|nr:tetratricopeptide repeat protein [Rhizohabitans arisaemae]